MSAGAPNHPTAEPNFGHFRIERRADGTLWTLGVGAMGVTYKAWDEKLRLAVALKVITASQVQNPQAQALFLREARAAARVRHTNVASVLALGDTPGNLHYAMEFVDGLSLAERLRQSAPLPPLLALDLALQTARGLEAIHEQKLVHRDLKPANLMLLATPHPPHQEAWRVKIIDFGLARLVGGTPPEEKEDDTPAPTIGFRGTTLYASPEQCEERSDLDGRSDLYALGCVLWEMLVGTPPFHARTHREVMNLHVHAPPPLERLAHLPLSLQAIVARLLLKDRDGRFADAGALEKALEKARAKIESGEDVGDDPLAATLPQVESPGPTVLPRSQDPKPTDPATTPVLLPPASVLPSSSAVLRPSVLCYLKGLMLGLVAIVVTVLAIGLVKYELDKGPEAPATNVAAVEKSLAVLPFENASDANDDAFFADGIMDDVLTSLAKIKDLKVINRTSVLLYRGAAGAAKLREIGQELGVTNVLEGRVRRSANRVVVTVQLTDVRTARQLWAERYDRTLADSLTLQGELAQEIARELRATLSPAESRNLSAKPTENDEAYTLYLRSRELALRQGNEEGKASQAVIDLLTKAIALDPKFALAHARLAEAQAYAYHFFRPSEELLQQAWASARESLRLNPHLGEGHYALGLCYYCGSRDYEAALRENEIARQSIPGDAEVIAQTAYVRRRQGRWREAIMSQEQARLLDPRNFTIADGLLGSYLFVRDWDRAAIAARRLADLSPPEKARFILAQVDLEARAELDSTRAALAAATAASGSACELAVQRHLLALYERNFLRAEQALRECPSGTVDLDSVPIPKPMLAGFVAKLQGETERAKPLLEEARAYLEAEVAKYPGNIKRLQMLGVAHALLGRKDDALSAARRSMEMVPIAKDALDGAEAEIWAGIVYAMVGDPDQAMDLIERSVVTPAGTRMSQLRLHPMYDSLRSNARFQKLLASPEPKTILR